MDALNKRTNEEFIRVIRDSTPSLQRKLNNKLLTLKKANKLYRLSLLQQTEV